MWFKAHCSYCVMAGKRYEELRAFQACDSLVIAVYDTVRTWPKYELYGLTSQARRCAFSSAANIAEGAGKRGYREFRRYLDITLGSLSELSYVLRLAHRLNYTSTEEHANLDRLLDEAGKLSFSLARALDHRLSRARNST
jgi:four helix bundle protein